MGGLRASRPADRPIRALRCRRSLSATPAALSASAVPLIRAELGMRSAEFKPRVKAMSQITDNSRERGCCYSGMSFQMSTAQRH